MRPLRDSRPKEKVKSKKAGPALFPFSFLLLPSAPEKLLHQRATLSFQNSFDYLHAMIELFGVADMKMRFDGARLFIGCAINQTFDARLKQRPGAHPAGLNSRVNNCLCQAVISEFLRSFTQRHDLRVRSRIAIGARAIAGDCQQLSIDNDACSDG